MKIIAIIAMFAAWILGIATLVVAKYPDQFSSAMIVGAIALVIAVAAITAGIGYGKMSRDFRQHVGSAVGLWFFQGFMAVEWYNGFQVKDAEQIIFAGELSGGAKPRSLQ